MPRSRPTCCTTPYPTPHPPGARGSRSPCTASPYPTPHPPGAGRTRSSCKLLPHKRRSALAACYQGPTGRGPRRGQDHLLPKYRSRVPTLLGTVPSARPTYCKRASTRPVCERGCQGQPAGLPRHGRPAHHLPGTRWSMSPCSATPKPSLCASHDACFRGHARGGPRLCNRKSK